MPQGKGVVYNRRVPITGEGTDRSMAWRLMPCTLLALSCAHRSAVEPSAEQDAPPQASPSLQQLDQGKAHVVLLGTGTPNADPAAHGPALAVVAGGAPYIVDCGPGVVRRAAAAQRRGVEALAMENLRSLLLTHLHSDHTAGYPDLLLTPWVLGRDQPLSVWGPPGTAAMTEHLQQAYQQDVEKRLVGLEPANELGYRVEVEEIEAGEIHSDEDLVIGAFPARHGAWEKAYGFRFETPSATICISGDSAPHPQMVENYRGCDILIHEVYCAHALEERPPVWQAYHRGSHTSGLELGEIAAQAQPELLVLTHVLAWTCDERELLAEIRTSFHGQVVYGRDLMVIGTPAERAEGDDFYLVVRPE